MPGEERFAEVKKLFERAGYRLVRVCGSHHYFAKPGGRRFPFPSIGER